jgi:hypothetical protein
MVGGKLALLTIKTRQRDDVNAATVSAASCSAKQVAIVAGRDAERICISLCVAPRGTIS